MQMLPEAGQTRAWEHCFDLLQRYMGILIDLLPGASDWTMIFEYELPRERVRWPDLVILADDAILVLEFKNFNTALQAHIDQVAARLRFCMRVVWQGGRYSSVCNSLPCQLCTSCISMVSPSSKSSVLQPNPMRTNRS
jgi:hypothetical protein